MSITSGRVLNVIGRPKNSQGRQPPGTAGANTRDSPQAYLILPLILAALGIAFLSAGYLYYQTQKIEAEASARSQLSAIADLKVQQIVAWRRERLGAAELLAANPMVTAQTGSRDDAKLARWLEHFRKLYGYSDAAILDAKGRLRIAGAGTAGAPNRELRITMAMARGNREAAASDLEESSDTAYMDVVAPVVEPRQRWVQELVYLRVDADAFLNAIISPWPTPSQTAESLLVRAGGRGIQYLSEPRQRLGSRLAESLPPQNDPVAAMAVVGQTGPRDGMDYRGTPVIAVLRQVPETPWALVTKMDEAEVYVPLRRRSRVMGLIVGLLLASAAATLGLFWHLRQSRFYRREHLVERQRRNLADRYSHLSRLVNDIVLMLDENGQVVEANDRAVQAYGYSRSELLGLWLRDLVDPAELPNLARRWQNVAKRGAEVFEVVHRRKDGSLMPTEVSSRTVELDGRIFRHSLIRDITERKRAEEELRRATRAMRVLSTSNQAVVRAGDEQQLYADICGAITGPGSYAMAWVGFAEHNDQKSVRTVASFGSGTDYLESHGITWDDSPTGQGPTGKCIRTGRAAVSNDLQSDTGFAIWRERAAEHGYRSVAGLPLRCDGEVIGALTIYASEPDAFHPEELRLLEELAGDLAYGIESRRRRQQQALAEEAVREAANEFRTLFDSASDSIFITDFEGRFLEANQGACQRLGYSRDELLKMSIPDIDPQAGSPWLAEQFAQLLANGSVMLETTHTRRDGTVIPVEVNSRVFQYRRRSANLSIARDISERKKAEAEARIRTLEMEQAKTEAESANRAKSEFLANVSHEIRTPMNGIVGMTGLLLDTSLTLEQREFTETIRRSAGALLGIVNDVLDLSKIEAGKMTVEQVGFDLIACIEAVGELMAPQARRKGLEYRFEAETPWRFVWGDAGRMRQIVLNLVSNAIKFTERGEIVLRIASEISGERHARFRVSVADTGIGIAADKLPLLFQKFAQVDSSLVKKHEGTGLGLAISRQLAELMGGALSATSELAKGSIFTLDLTLPLHSGSEPERWPMEAGLHDTLQGKHRRILVAEDNLVNQKIAVLTLEKMGCRVDLAANGREAVEMAGRFPYDAILMDCGMPEMDGYTATREIRAREPEGSRVPIVALTAHAICGTREQCLAAGMDDYIAKPFSRACLEKALLRWSP